MYYFEWLKWCAATDRCMVCAAAWNPRQQLLHVLCTGLQLFILGAHVSFGFIWYYHLVQYGTIYTAGCVHVRFNHV